MHVHLPSPLPLPLPPPKKKKKKEKKIVRKLPPPKKWILCKKKSLITIPAPPTRPDHNPPKPTQFFSDLDIWIICQLDSVLVIFLQIDK